VKIYNEYLRDLIVNVRATPGKIVSHHIQIEDAPEAHEKFDKRIEGYTKVLIWFAGAAQSAAADWRARRSNNATWRLVMRARGRVARFKNGSLKIGSKLA
jgi:hypothetical protein